MAEPTSSLTAHVRPLPAGAEVVRVSFLNGAPALALADGAALIGEPDAQKRVTLHRDGAILMARSDGKRLVWASNRNGKQANETNIFIADWVE